MAVLFSAAMIFAEREGSYPALFDG